MKTSCCLHMHQSSLVPPAKEMDDDDDDIVGTSAGGVAATPAAGGGDLAAGAIEEDSGPKGWRVMVEDEDKTKTGAAAAMEKLRIMVIFLCILAQHVCTYNFFINVQMYVLYICIYASSCQ